MPRRTQSTHCWAALLLGCCIITALLPPGDAGYACGRAGRSQPLSCKYKETLQQDEDGEDLSSPSISPSARMRRCLWRHMPWPFVSTFINLTIRMPHDVPGIAHCKDPRCVHAGWVLRTAPSDSYLLWHSASGTCLHAAVLTSWLHAHPPCKHRCTVVSNWNAALHHPEKDIHLSKSFLYEQGASGHEMGVKEVFIRYLRTQVGVGLGRARGWADSKTQFC